MRYTQEQIEQNMNSIDRQLLMMIYEELREINQKLGTINRETEQVVSTPDSHKGRSRGKQKEGSQ